MNRSRNVLPASSPHLTELSLTELRAYRARLRDEEERASYWRRLVHARIDLLEVRGTAEGSLSLPDLVRALGDTGTGQVRHALHRIRAADPLPDLPVPEDVWLVPTDDSERAEALRRLSDAERQLTGYRSALHERIDEATAELIARYRTDPLSALSAMPA